MKGRVGVIAILMMLFFSGFVYAGKFSDLLHPLDIYINITEVTNLL
jgi:hypothetical protein